MKKTSKRTLTALMAAMILATTSVVAAIPVFAAETQSVSSEQQTASVAIDEKNFPDENFRAIVLKKIDTDGDGMLSLAERNAVTTLSIRCSQEAKNILGFTEKEGNSIGYRWYNGKAVDLTGLEYFTNLDTLYLSNIDPVGLPLDKLINLREVYFTSMPVVSLDFSQNKKLENIYCRCFNLLESINLQGLDQLPKLTLSKCNLNSLDLSSNTNLKEIYLDNNKFHSINLSNNTLCERLDFEGIPLTELDISGLNQLTYLNIDGCAFDEVNADTLKVSENTKLEELSAQKMTQCTRLDVSHISSLKKVTADENVFTSIKIGENLKELHLHNSKKLPIIDSTTLEAPTNSALSGIYLYKSNTKKLSTSHLKSLTWIEAIDCQLEHLNISGNTALTYLSLTNESWESGVTIDENKNLKTMIVNPKLDKDVKEELETVKKLTGGKITYIPEKITDLKAIKKTKTTLKLTFNAVSGASGYKIYDAATGKVLANVSTQKGAKKLVKTITGLKAGEQRKYKVRGYVTVNGTKHYGAYSNIYTKSTAN